MKTTKQIALALTICLPLLLTACQPAPTAASGGDNPVEPANSAAYVSEDVIVRKTFPEIRESFDSDIEAIKSKEYDNLNFDKAVFSPPPQIDSISELKLKMLTGKSTDEIYNYFCEMIDTLSDNAYTDEEKNNKILFADVEPDENGAPPAEFPNIDEYKNGLETDYPRPFLIDGKYYFSMFPGILRAFDNHDLMIYSGVDPDELDGYGYAMIQNENHRNVLYTEDLNSTDTFRLTDGEMSIANAAKFAQDYLDNLAYTPYADANLPKPIIYAVNVFDIGNGCYGYSFLTTVEYNGVSFDHNENKSGGMGLVTVVTDYDERRYNSWVGRVEMIRTYKIHRFEDIVRGYDVTEGEPTTEIITASSAADAVSEFFSGYMNFTVTEVSMVWLEKGRKYGENETDAYPCWKFKMNYQGEIYHTFVDVITGEIHLYVQVV